MLMLSSLLAFTLAAEADRTLTVEVGQSLPTFSQIAVYRSGDAAKPKPLAIVASGTPTVLPSPGPFEVQATPKGGLRIVVAQKLEIPAGAARTLKLAELLGVVEVLGDNFPRAESIVITAKQDPGPGEKGHVPVQRAKEYREEMVVPEGNYAVWIVPANGSRALKVRDDIRVLCGRSLRVE